MGARKDERERLEQIFKDRYLEPITAAYYALRSYQCGNKNPELARETADRLELTLSHAGRPPVVSGKRLEQQAGGEPAADPSAKPAAEHVMECASGCGSAHA